MSASPVRNSVHRQSARGFTLVELMAVVAIVGILALISANAVVKYIRASKTTEALNMITTIKAAQETYKVDTFSYLNVSGGLTAAASFYPNNPLPGRQRMNFAGAGNGQAGWQTLGVQADAPVMFVYACTAGAANTAPTALGGDITVGNWPASVASPWYVVKARADLVGDGTMTVYVSGSFANELYSANAP